MLGFNAIHVGVRFLAAQIEGSNLASDDVHPPARDVPIWVAAMTSRGCWPETALNTTAGTAIFIANRMVDGWEGDSLTMQYTVSGVYDISRRSLRPHRTPAAQGVRSILDRTAR